MPLLKLQNFKEKLPYKYNKIFYKSLAAFRLKWLYWHLKSKKFEIEKRFGYKNCKKFFYICSNYHKKILKEKDHNRRANLYNEFNNYIYNFRTQHWPERETHGFTPDLINCHKDLFKFKTVIDYGCGQGVSTELISNSAKFVYGIDASITVIETAERKFGYLKNAEFKHNPILFIPFDDEAIDVVYSDNLIEHLHPDDLDIHLKEVYRILKNEGKYLFRTPGSETGPHDTTRFFYPGGMGFKSRAGHIKEYTYAELITIVQKTGYRKIELPDLEKKVLVMIASK